MIVLPLRAPRTSFALALCAWLLVACGDDGAAVRFNAAVAALRAGDLENAQRAAQEAARRGGAPYEGRRAFVRGNVAFARSEALEAQGGGPPGDPEARKAALKLAEDALAYWMAAAASRWDWPAARRNVERALGRLERLRERRSAAPGRTDPPPGTPATDGPGPSTTRRPTPGAGSTDVPTAPEPAGEPADLPPGRVLGLLQVLDEQEGQKRALRRAQRDQRADGTERDW